MWLRWVFCAVLAMQTSPVAARNADFAFTEYRHTRWTADQGAPAPIYNMVQDHKGYLWLATGHGVYRFDGIAFEKIPPVRGMDAQAGAHNLFVARDGAGWSPR